MAPQGMDDMILTIDSGINILLFDYLFHSKEQSCQPPSPTLSVGADTPILGAATTSANGAITQSVEYKPTGVQLNIKPDVRDEVSELTITQTISEAVATSTGVNGTPTFTKREISSVVGVRDGDVVLLGGMEEAIDQKGRSGLPFLPAFLQANTAGKTKTEVLLVLNVQRI